MEKKTKTANKIYQLKITLRGIRPPIWRRVRVKDSTLAELHETIQTCMAWAGYHLHSFEVGGEEFGEPDPDGMLETSDSRRLKLSRIVAQGFKKFTYTYDFGDNWQHTILMEKTLPAEKGAPYPRCVAGKRASPPEDCGGVWGYADLLEAAGDPANKQYEQTQDWLGDDFDPEAFDLEAINKQLR